MEAVYECGVQWLQTTSAYLSGGRPLRKHVQKEMYDTSMQEYRCYESFSAVSQTSELLGVGRTDEPEPLIRCPITVMESTKSTNVFQGAQTVWWICSVIQALE